MIHLRRWLWIFVIQSVGGRNVLIPQDLNFNLILEVPRLIRDKQLLVSCLALKLFIYDLDSISVHQNFEVKTIIHKIELHALLYSKIDCGISYIGHIQQNNYSNKEKKNYLLLFCK